ncbi:MAG: Sua5/YciO/YrdC/YwlC family protein, partial [Chloroflexi bacterium]|nr:Sua5/YciO/YrdC/YwlC family protein [Chloroflexota bacterium]
MEIGDWRFQSLISNLQSLDPIDAAQKILSQGKIIAIKGLGGFHLACDATNEEAVAELRKR